MERDKRMGVGHWRGCHTFTNIAYDGSLNNSASVRSGGLKMGCTYWYYYLLDDDVEHYNEAEPMTTHCPFLPGQPVNVVQIPIVLPDTTSTHTSRSPNVQRPQQTMNPEDKFMNPREPPKPKPRLRTSPQQTPTSNLTLGTSPLGVINRGSSQPAHDGPKIWHPRNEEKTARSVSPPRSRGLRAAFHQLNGSASRLSPMVDHDRGITFPAIIPNTLAPPHDNRIHVRSQSNDSYMRSPSIGNMTECRGGDNLPFRRPVSARAHDSASMTIQERRALNTKAPADSTPKNPLTLRPKQPWVGLGNLHSHLVRRPASTPSTPSMLRRPSDPATTPQETMPLTPETVMNKRLPTLPNSPSSVMDEALRDLDEKEKALDMEALASHFSDFTETSSTDGGDLCEKSRFSEWSTDTDMVSPESMVSSSIFNEKQNFPKIPAMELPEDSNAPDDGERSNLNTPHLTAGSNPSPALSEDTPPMDLPPPRLTVALSPSELNIPGLHINEEEELLESNPKRHAALFQAMELKGLGLSSPPADKVRFSESIDNEVSRDNNITPTNDPARHSKLLSQSATMKEMMDELSYLKNMIQSGGVPEV